MGQQPTRVSKLVIVRMKQQLQPGSLPAILLGQSNNYSPAVNIPCTTLTSATKGTTCYLFHPQTLIYSTSAYVWEYLYMSRLSQNTMFWGSHFQPIKNVHTKTVVVLLSCNTLQRIHIPLLLWSVYSQVILIFLHKSHISNGCLQSFH